MTCGECLYDPTHLYHSYEDNLMNSTELHAALTSTFAEAERHIRSESGFTGSIGFSIWGGDAYGKALNINIRTGYSTKSKEVEVSGRDFWDCVSEFTRRLAFAERQSKLQLGPPMIDAESET